jgi:hypothetical protein
VSKRSGSRADFTWFEYGGFIGTRLGLRSDIGTVSLISTSGGLLRAELKSWSLISLGEDNVAGGITGVGRVTVGCWNP